MPPDAPQRARPDAIPSALRDRPQWVVWRYTKDPKRDKVTKVPFNARNPKARASSTDPRTWADFDTAYSVEGVDGIGFVLAEDDDLIGIDLDLCINENGDLHPYAEALVDRLSTYAERSPSGTGVRIICKGNLPGRRRETSDVPWGEHVHTDEREAEFAIFDRSRFLTLTGDTLNGAEITAPQDEINALVAELLPPLDNHSPVNGAFVHPTVKRMSDTDLMRKARRAENSEKFIALWNGDRLNFPSDSEADLALISLIAFWTGPDPERIQRLFMQSARGDRAKAKRPDYVPRSIEQALKRRTSKFYNPDDEPDDNSPTEPEAVADELTRLLRLRKVGVHVTGARIVGRGSKADAWVHLSNGDDLTFKPIGQRAQSISLEVAAVTGAIAPLKQGESAVVVAFIRRLAQLQDAFTEEDIARDWGKQFLSEADLLDFDLNDKDERWGAFMHLRGQTRFSKCVLRHHDGSLYVRTGWFNHWVREQDPSVGSNAAIARRMETVGWQKRGSGRITAHSPDRKKQLGWNFFVVLPDWGDEG